jgi:hypothetical protein
MRTNARSRGGPVCDLGTLRHNGNRWGCARAGRSVAASVLDRQTRCLVNRVRRPARRPRGNLHQTVPPPHPLYRRQRPAVGVALHPSQHHGRLGGPQGTHLHRLERSPSHSRHLVYNLSRPEKSLILLAPLAEAAAGFGLCRDPATRQPATVFASTTDPDYQKLLALCVSGKARLDEIRRFDMPGFRPPKEWVREMKRYGLLPADVESAAPVNVYAAEQNYWRSLWPMPSP